MRGGEGGIRRRKEGGKRREKGGESDEERGRRREGGGEQWIKRGCTVPHEPSLSLVSFILKTNQKEIYCNFE